MEAECKEFELLDVPAVQKTTTGCANPAPPNPDDDPADPGLGIRDDIPIIPDPPVEPPGTSGCEPYARSNYLGTFITGPNGSGGPNYTGYDQLVTLLSPSCYGFLNGRLSSQNFMTQAPPLGQAPPGNIRMFRNVNAKFEQAESWCSVPFNRSITSFSIYGAAWNIYWEGGFAIPNVIAESEFFNVDVGIRTMPDGSCIVAGGGRFGYGQGGGFGSGPVIPIGEPPGSATTGGLATKPHRIAVYGKVMCSQLRFVPGPGGLLGGNEFVMETKCGIIKNATVVLDSVTPLKFTINAELEDLGVMNGFGRIAPIAQGSYAPPDLYLPLPLVTVPAHNLYGDGTCPTAGSFGGGFSASAEFIPRSQF